MEHTFDAIIVGAGQAGPALAGRLTKAGWKIAFVERKLFGGTCVNTGCTPTKTMVASAHTARMVERAAEYGITGVRTANIDMAKVKQRKDKVVADSRNGVESSLRKMEGCTVFTGTAVFLSPHSMRLGENTLHAEKIFVNVGARPMIPSFEGVNDVPYLTSTTILDLTEVPEHLVVIGGSYVGLEFAQMFRRFGAQVTVVERGPRLVAHEDEDVSNAVRKILEAEDIHIRTEAECIRFEQRNNKFGQRDGKSIVHVTCRDEDPEVVASHILLAVGRVPNTDDLGLAAAGIEIDQHGFIPVDEQLRTKVEGIWALGDCNGRGAFTHTSYNDFEIVAANILDNDPRKVSDRIPVHALYIDPPLAQVGMTENEVRQTGKPALIGLRPMTRVSRAIEKGETQGFMKVLVDAESKEILGASILGVGGDEAIHCILTAMYAKQPASLLVRSMHIHPTVAELIPTVFGDLKPLV